MSSQERPARIRSRFVATCWASSHGSSLRSIWSPRSQIGGKPLPARVGRGVCVQPSFGSFIATVVEAEVDSQGEVSLRRIITAADVGTLVNPDSVEAQLQGGLVFGLTAALYGEITIKNGRVQQSNFNDYRMLRINQNAEDRGAFDQERRAPRGRRRDRYHGGAAGAAQCDLCRHRRCVETPAHRSGGACRANQGVSAT